MKISVVCKQCNYNSDELVFSIESFEINIFLIFIAKCFAFLGFKLDCIEIIIFKLKSELKNNQSKTVISEINIRFYNVYPNIQIKIKILV